MGIFFIITFGITLLCILWLISPLLKKQLNKDSHTSEDQNIAVKPRFITSIVMTLVVAIGGWLVYFSVGDVTIIEKIEKAQQSPITSPEVDELIAQLDQHLKDNDDDLEGWLIKARIEMSRGNSDIAYTASKTAYQLSKTDDYAQILSDMEKAEIIGRYVDTSVVLEQGKFSDNTHRLLQEALQLDNQNPQALWLSAMSFSQQGNHEKSLELFTKTRDLISIEGTDLPEVAQLDQLIAAEQRLVDGSNNIISLPNSADSTNPEDIAFNKEIIQQALNESPVKAATPSNEQPSIKKEPVAMPEDLSEIPINVTLSPEIAQNASPDDTIFIIARSLKGPKTPLVVIKKQVKDLPLSAVIDDSKRMLPFTTVGRVASNKNMMIIARISKSSQPIKQPEDIEKGVALHEWFEQGNELPINIEISQ